MLYKPSLVFPNHPGTITWVNIRLALSQATTLVRLRTPEGRRISIKSLSDLHPRGSHRILCREDRGDCGHPQLTGRQEVTVHPVMLETVLVATVTAWDLVARVTPCLAGEPEEDALQGCRMMSGQDNGRIIM